MSTTQNYEPAFFKPVGPLKYLLMDSQGNALLGLYQHIYSGQLVLFAKPFGVAVIFEPAGDNLQELMKDQVSLRELLSRSRWKTSKNQDVSIWMNAMIRVWISLNIPVGTMRSFKGRHYPNYYYVLVNAKCN